MKNLLFSPRCTRNIGAVLFLGLPAFYPLAAQEVSKSQIQANAADQQDIRAHTAAVVGEVQKLIDELIANGITGDDVKVLQTTKAVLTHLSGPEMDRVLASLQKAGKATTESSTQQNAVAAYAGQKGIVLQFQLILKDYEQRQAAYDLPVRFQDLAKRQTDTMRASAQVARETAGKSPGEMTSMQQTTQQIVQSDQDAIVNEVNLAADQLDKAVQGATGDQGKAMAQAQKDLKSGDLQKALAQADEDLKAGKTLKALGEQKIARDALLQVNKDLNPPASAADALADTEADLDKLIEDQKKLLGDTTASLDVKPLVTGLDARQGDLVDDADTLQKSMTTLSPTSGALVRDAITPMQESRAALNPHGGVFTRAVDDENLAIAKLEEAQKQTQQQLADAQKAAADAAKDPTAALAALQQQIQAAMQQQQQITSQTAQAQNNPTAPDASATAQAQQAQAQLQQQTAAMQQTAQPASLAAAQALANAANNMNQAQQALANPATAQAAQADQQAAQQALANASQQVAQAQQAAQAAQNPPDPSALAQAANALQQAQDSVSSAIAATTPPPAGGTPPAGAPPAGGAPPPGGTPPAGGAPPAGAMAGGAPPPGGTPPAGGAPPAGAMAGGAPPPGAPPLGADAAAAKALADAAKETQQAAQTPGLPQGAADAVKTAQGDIAKGEQMAAQKNTPGVQAAADAAQQALAQAQAAVAMAQAGMAPGGQEMAGGGPPDGSGPGQGPPMPGGPPGNQPGPPGSISATDIGSGSMEKGTLHGASGKGKFVSVAARDRTAIDQSQGEKRPEEYAPQIDQYLKNLADQSVSAQ